MNNVYFLSEHTLGLDPSSEAWFTSALQDAEEEAKRIAAEMCDPSEPDYMDLVEYHTHELRGFLYALGREQMLWLP